MRAMTGIAGMALAGVLAACVPVEGPGGGGYPGPAGGGVNQCGALDLQFLVGGPATALNTMRFNKPVRVIYPDTAVTMDFNADRLNFEVDRMGRISRVSCG
ncbi:MAG: hypothetical protein Q27BPR15_18145 [Rhodobacter sp. CACIA14H1]|nr:MAG: hypothetical protein Q27BPR15_18145 [Rhodobacter sp. CACIA14H1]